MPSTNPLLDAYVLMVIDRIEAGWTPYFLSFMFHPLSGGNQARIAQMTREIERVYAKVLTRIVRNPNSNSGAELCPFWLACPDWPVPKSNKDHFNDLAINDGLHFHVLVLIPPTTRMVEQFNLHIASHQQLYAPPGSALARIDVVTIRETPEVAARYILKSLERGRIDAGEIFVLPRSRSELSERDEAIEIGR